MAGCGWFGVRRGVWGGRQAAQQVIGLWDQGGWPPTFATLSRTQGEGSAGGGCGIPAEPLRKTSEIWDSGIRLFP